MRKASIFLATIVALPAALGPLALTTSPANAGEQAKLVQVTPGESPFASCIADDVAGQLAVCETAGAPCSNYPNTEIEPFVAANPAHRKNLITVWQQDRWSNGGSRGLVAGYSKNGGQTWAKSVPPGVSACTGGEYVRASDPWVSISPSGTAYFMSLAFDPDLTTPTGEFAGFGDNAMLVSRSTDGGATWGNPVTLIKDTSPQVLNDKNSLTADPTNPTYAYAVWDRLRDFTVPPEEPAVAAAGMSALKATDRRDGMDGVVRARERLKAAGVSTLSAAVHHSGMDGVALARARVKRLKAAAQAAALAAAGAAPVAPDEAVPPELEVTFEGPTYFTRTTDGGQSWEQAREIYDPGPNAQTIANQIVVPPNGNLIDFFTHIFPNGVTRLDLLRSFDKGASFEVAPIPVDLIFSIGTITPDLQEPVRDASALFDVAVDPHSGVLYAVWQDVRFAGVEEVAFAQSNDNGLTWSTQVRVNQTPVNTANPLREQAFLPSIEVGAEGQLVVTYYDFRNDNVEGGELTDYWAVYCSDECTRGESWDEELRLTDRSFDMLDAPVAGGHFLGDYMGLVAAGHLVHPVFGVADGPNQTSLYTRRIRPGFAGDISALP